MAMATGMPVTIKARNDVSSVPVMVSPPETRFARFPPKGGKRLGTMARAAGEGPREAGIDGNCESSYEADSGCDDLRQRSKEADARRRSFDRLLDRVLGPLE